jgi:hypothetical protein
MLRLWGFFFDSLLGKAVAAGAGLLALASWYTMQQREIGAERARAEIEREAREDVEKADSVRRAVRSGSARGVQRDPYAEAD